MIATIHARARKGGLDWWEDAKKAGGNWTLCANYCARAETLKSWDDRDTVPVPALLTCSRPTR